MRVALPLRQARREVHGMILVFRESATAPSPIRSHPGAPVPSDTNPFARDPPSPPEQGQTPSGLPAWHLKSRTRQVGSSRFVDYERKQAPVPHGVPPNFPDDQLEGKRRLPGWAVWFVGIFALSIIEDIVVARTRAAKRRDEEKDEHGNEVRPEWDERGDRMRAMNAQRTRVEEQARRIQGGRGLGPAPPQQNQWGDSPESFDAGAGRSSEAFGRG
ncbi:hypothetical protein CC85DRAFT_207341 [Cutaneotrichosporon oleaginosum]|uniref:Transmembrane protein n=1 Tax=Cutaneotrichosporon oleaginosum TaxID=879819 RepID=A0A0J0XDG8_9TREE|nr:uncharacterized protein CC85DRAFT_207341 [Cutaneotrichosporon oleaginosum]KLT39112.1 hypothetical protein CC85DRAFT_207341 [Cutaneotrichosporon oleaginosum]TXT10452.1 hypothetical protein COLE_04386 [Cutaneotrichosporon oleaginosum]